VRLIRLDQCLLSLTQSSRITVRHSLSNCIDPQFLSAEDFTFRFTHQITQISRASRKIQKSYGDAGGVEADLGRGYNGWSLVESEISRSVENIGTVFDGGAVASATIGEELEGVCEEIQEYVSYGKVHYIIVNERWLRNC
jgi:hypothetical protein